MTGLDVFIVSFCVAFIVASDRFKASVSGLGRLIRSERRRIPGSTIPPRRRMALIDPRGAADILRSHSAEYNCGNQRFAEVS